MNLMIYIVLNLITCLLSNTATCSARKRSTCSTYEIGKYKDVSLSINLLHSQLPDHMPMKQKCKRYAVVSYKALSERLPHEGTVRSVLAMDDLILDNLYSQLNDTQLSLLYMIAVDRYRVTQLARPFLDIIECLRKIGTNAVKAFLNNPELVLITDLYRHAIGLSDEAINPAKLDLTKLGQSFWKAFRRLFEGLIDIDGFLKGIPQLGAIETSDVSNSVHNPGEASTSRYWPEDHGHSLDNQKRLDDIRERARLAARRSRIINSEMTRRKTREYHQRRRKRIQQEEEQLYSIANPTPEVLEVKRQLHEKRAKINARRRQRLKELRDRRRQRDENLKFCKLREHDTDSALWKSFLIEPPSPLSDIVPAHIDRAQHSHLGRDASFSGLLTGQEPNCTALSLSDDPALVRLESPDRQTCLMSDKDISEEHFHDSN